MIQSRQGITISAPEEIAYINGFIGREKLMESAKAYGKSPYGEHLKAVAESDSSESVRVNAEGDFAVIRKELRILSQSLRRISLMLIKDVACPGGVNFLFIEQRPFFLILRKIATALWEYGLAEAVGGVGFIIAFVNE